MSPKLNAARGERRAQGLSRAGTQAPAQGDARPRGGAGIPRSRPSGNPANPSPSFARLASLFELVADEYRRLVAIGQDRLAEVAESSGHDHVDPHERRNEEREQAQDGAHADPDLLSAAEVARRLGCDVRTLRRMRHEGRAPISIKVGPRPRWRRADVEAWLASRKEAR